MLEKYFVKPTTVDRVRACWIGSEVEQYAGWLADKGYAHRCVLSRVPLLVAFGEFARQRGAKNIDDLASYVEAFAAERVSTFRRAGTDKAGPQQLAKEVRGPIEQMLELVVPGFVGRGGRIAELLSPLCSLTSSSTWCRNVACVQPRSCNTGFTWIGLRPTLAESESTGFKT